MTHSDSSDDLDELREQVRAQLLNANPAPFRMWMVVLAASLAAASLAVQLVRPVDTGALVTRLLADPAFKNEATAAIQMAAPVGSVVAWPVDSARLPEGWHVCDGAELSTEDYRELTKILDATYGRAGPLKVKLPDFRGYFLRGEGPGSEKLGERQQDALGRHSHTVAVFHKETENGRGGYWALTALGREVQDEAGHPRAFALESAAAGGDETRPKNHAVHWVIRIR